MKTNSTFSLLAFLLLLGSFSTYSQSKSVSLEDPLKKEAFDKNIINDINFLVLGDNNPKQGFSYEYDEKKTELSLSGLLSSFKHSILTIDGSFAVDDGSYIFDSKDGGATKGNLSINYFIPVLNSKAYEGAKTAKKENESFKTNRARQINYNAEIILPQKVLDSFAVLNKIIEDLSFPNYTIKDEEKSKLYENLTPSDPDKKVLLSKLLKYYKKANKAEDTSYDVLLSKLKKSEHTTYLIKDKKGNGSFSYNVPTGFDVEALFEDYDKSIDRLENIDDEVFDKQIKNFEGLWTSERNRYFGLSTFYQRESLDIYNNLGADFSSRFTDTRGDLYGFTGSYSTIKRYQNGLFYFARGLLTFGRATNFKDFSKKEYVYSGTGENLGSGTIYEEEKKTGYYEKNGLPYQYGFLQKYGIEFYGAYKVIGIYGKLSYSRNSALYKQETTPFEAGIILNVKSEKKNVVSILLFVAREDLNVHPDLDTNFGFKIGLPINIRKYDKDSSKENEEEKS